MNTSTREQSRTDMRVMVRPEPEPAPRREPAVLTVVDSVLDPATCEALIAKVDDQRWLSSTAELSRSILRRRPPHRVAEPDAPCRMLGANTRPRFSAIENPLLALRMFYRLSATLPKVHNGAQLAGLKPLLRCFSFGPGEGTQPHRDPIRECAEGQRSALSLVVFLNDDFAGGALEFPEQSRTIEAQTGRAVVFSHDVLHGDAIVDDGQRYVLLGEVFYSERWRPYQDDQ